MKNVVFVCLCTNVRINCITNVNNPSLSKFENVYIHISVRNGRREWYSNGECFLLFSDWDGLGDHERVKRQLSVSSDSKLLDEDICEETRVILRPKKPPRPKSEVFLNKDQQQHRRRTKRYSAFGVSKSFLLDKGEVIVSLERDSGGNYFYSKTTNILSVVYNQKSELK